MATSFYTVLQGESKSVVVAARRTRLVELQSVGGKTPFFMVGSFGGFVDVIKLLGPERPVLCLVAQEQLDVSRPYDIATEAATHVETILRRQPQGPYMLGGCSGAGIVAYETANQLQNSGHEVALLVLFDTPNISLMPEYSGLRAFLANARNAIERIRWGDIPGRVTLGKLKMRLSGGITGVLRASSKLSQPLDHFALSEIRIAAARKYQPPEFFGKLLLIRRYKGLTSDWLCLGPDFGWAAAAGGRLETCLVDASDHMDLFQSEADRVRVANQLRESFRAVDLRGGERRAHLRAVKS